MDVSYESVVIRGWVFLVSEIPPYPSRVELDLDAADSAQDTAREALGGDIPGFGGFVRGVCGHSSPKVSKIVTK